ncbi:MAG: VOC family protein [Deltaproteobacteria bacterium]|nr:VOC family protein [Deltaproteobacteria bacterium]MBW2362279.1 VOC family protein [Deltaproteobacteria bacterium]
MFRGGIDHLDLTVMDPAASEAFYTAVLGYMGFEPVRLAHGATQLRIFQATDAGQRLFSVALQPARHGGGHDRHSPGLHHVAFRASSRADVDGLYQLLRDFGADVLDAPAEYPHYAPGYYAVFFADPDGLKLEFVHMPTPPELAV